MRTSLSAPTALPDPAPAARAGTASRRAWLGALGALGALAGTALLWPRGPAAWHRAGGGGGGATAGMDVGADELCIVAPLLPPDAAQARDLGAARPVPAHARCPVCGMFPARQPRWAAQAIHRDGHVHFLDSPLSLFLYLQRVPRYAPGRRREDLIALHVSDHDGAGWLRADRAVYVHGSREAGPMRGGNLPAFASAAAAGAFIARAGGRATDFDSLSRALPEDLARQAPHRHDGAAGSPRPSPFTPA